MAYSEIFHRAETLPGKGGAETSEVPLPSGWTCLHACDLGGRLNRPAQVDYVLLHPETGIALLDIGRADATDAEAVLRARLRVACFEGIFPGYLPIVHLLVAPGDLPAIEGTLKEAFAALPPLSLPGGDAWISVVRRALSPHDPVRGAGPLDESRTQPERQPRQPDAADQARRRPVSWPTNLRAIPAQAADPAARGEARGNTEELPIESPPSAAEPRRPWVWAMAGLGGFAVLASGLGALLTGGPHSAPRPATVGPPMVAAAVQDPQPVPSERGNDRITAGASPPALPMTEAPAAAPAPSRTAMVRVRANLREGPSLSATVLRTLPPGQEFRIHGRAPGGWLQVGNAEPLGWMHSSVLNEVQP